MRWSPNLPIHHLLTYMGLFLVLSMRIIITTITTVEPMDMMSVNSCRPLGDVVLEVVVDVVVDVVVEVVVVVTIVESALTVTMTESDAVASNSSSTSNVKLYSPTAKPSML